jgi:predicted phosphodiesterase
VEWGKIMTSTKAIRIAVLADIHANTVALDAVLKDIQANGGVNEYWLLGDYAALGPDPKETLEQLSELPEARFIRGNTDRYLISDEIPGPSIADLRKDITHLPRYVRLVKSFAWTQGALAASSWIEWLEGLPLEMRTQLPDGTRILAVHAAPGADDGNGINPATDEADLRIIMTDVQADLVLVGHTHVPFDRSIDEVRVINPGSVSNPLPPDLRACYALLIADHDGYQIYFQRVDYDRRLVIEAMRQRRYPSQNYVSRLLLGQIKPKWEK